MGAASAGSPGSQGGPRGDAGVLGARPAGLSEDPPQAVESLPEALALRLGGGPSPHDYGCEGSRREGEGCRTCESGLEESVVAGPQLGEALEQPSVLELQLSTHLPLELGSSPKTLAETQRLPQSLPLGTARDGLLHARDGIAPFRLALNDYDLKIVVRCPLLCPLVHTFNPTATRTGYCFINHNFSFRQLGIFLFQ